MRGESGNATWAYYVSISSICITYIYIYVSLSLSLIYIGYMYMLYIDMHTEYIELANATGACSEG